MKEERVYQKAIENEIPRRLKEDKHIIVQAPTGSGKSHIINQTVKRILKSGKTALVLSDSKKIHSQLLAECNAFPIVSHTKWLTLLDSTCYVAMTQSLSRRDGIVSQFKQLGSQLVIIVDECHRGTMTSLVEEIAPTWLIGFSATPHWRWAKHLPKLYNSLIHGPQINELIPNYLAHYSHTIRTGVNLTQLKLASTGDYTEESQDNTFGSHKVMYDGIFEDLPKMKFRKAVVYVASIRLAEQLYSEFLANGYVATCYHSQRTLRDLERFTNGPATVCISVSALTLGWDHPPIDLIVLWRATTSLPLYLQMCGRGARPLPGKDLFSVYDYGGNYERFGAWDMSRDWNSLWQEVKKRTTSTYAGVGASKECPVCHILLPTAARSCDNCGYIYPENEMRLVEGKLLEVQNTLRKLEGRRVIDLTAEELAVYAKLLDKRAHAVRVARRMEQEQSGFLKEFAIQMGYKDGWWRRQMESIGEQPIDVYNPKIKIA